MQMSEQALELLLETARAAAHPEQVVTGDPRKLTFIKGAKITEVAMPPPVRKAEVNSLEDLMLATRSDMATKPTIWHSSAGVVLVLNDTDRRDRVSFTLGFSGPFATLVQLASPDATKYFDQRQFLRLLRIDLGAPEPVVAPFRRLDWHTEKSAVGEIGPGRDRLGTDIQGNVAGAGDLPTDILFHVPIYSDLGERGVWPVRCEVELDLRNEKVGLIPQTGEIETAIDAAQGSIHDRLVSGLSVEGEEEIPIYYGCP